jgi:arginyl-tRNA synthetase
MNYFKYFREELIKTIERLADFGQVPAGLDLTRVAVESPRDPAHGDLATNAAMVLAKPAGLKPRELAERLAAGLQGHGDVEAVDVAGPGFINIRIRPQAWHRVLREVLVIGPDYGKSDLGRGAKVNVEYVSTNPTGPLTVGHARGAVFGDALASLLARVGYDVTREYYINDAGAQIDTLAGSLHLRYREALGEDIGEIPEGYYPGDYLKPIAAALVERDADRWQTAPPEDWLPVVRDFAIDALMAVIKEDLAALGIRQDVFFSERSLVAGGGVDAVVEALEERGQLYTGVLKAPKGKTPEDWEPRAQLLFRATAFGDDVDRPLRKSDGSWTYFAGDLAYHLDKFRRGFHTMIDVWGADHSGYVKRMKAGVAALTDGEGHLDVRICQLVTLLRAGEPVRMSKRAGTFVTLRAVIGEVGKDVVRFIMLTRKNDATLEFDLQQVIEKTRDNPVFYVQYAHARCCSVQRHAAESLPNLPQDAVGLIDANLNLLIDKAELDLIRCLAKWPKLLETAAEAYEPHRVAFYLLDLAAAFHGLWNKGKDEADLRFLIPDQPELTTAHLALIRAVTIVIASGLEIFGVEPVQEMH